MALKHILSHSSVASIVALSLSVSNAQQLIPRSQIEDLQSGLGAVPSTEPRPLTLLSTTLIMDFEGWQSKAYDDPVGLCTIGYGHLIALKSCTTVVLGRFQNGLTKEQGAALLEVDTRSSRSIVDLLVKRQLTDHQFGALASFAFNVGKSKLANSTLLKLVNSGNDELVASEFLRWVKANGRVFKGLQDRRACEAALYSGTLRGDATGKFYRAECSQGLGVAPLPGSLIDIDVGEVK